MFSDRCIQLTPSLRTCSSSQVDRYSSHDVSLILSHLSSGELQRCAVGVRAQTANGTMGSTSTHASVIHWNPASILDQLYVLPIATGQWQEATKTGKEEGGTGQYLIKMLAQISSPARRHIHTQVCSCNTGTRHSICFEPEHKTTRKTISSFNQFTVGS